MRRLEWLVCGLLILGAASCGSRRTPPPDEPLEPREEDKDYEFAAEWQALSQRLCEKLTQCAFQDAEANLPPEQVQELQQAGPIHTRECAKEYRRASPTRRQLDGIASCLDKHDDCERLLECMDRTGAPAPG